MHFALQLPDNLLESSPQFVAQDSISRFSGNTKTDPECLGAALASQDNQVAMPCRLALSENSLEFTICLKSFHLVGVCTERDGISESCGRTLGKDFRRLPSATAFFAPTLVGQLMPSSFSSASQNVTTAGRGHSFTKAMLFFTMADFGLVCPLHWFPPLKKLMTNIETMRGLCQAPETYSIYAQSFPHLLNPEKSRFFANFGILRIFSMVDLKNFCVLVRLKFLLPRSYPQNCG